MMFCSGKHGYEEEPSLESKYPSGVAHTERLATPAATQRISKQKERT